MPAPHSLADALRAYRARHSLSQSQLALQWGESVATIRGWESGRRGSSPLARTLARCLNGDIG